MKKMIHKIDENILLGSSKFKKQRDFWTRLLSETKTQLPILADGNGADCKRDKRNDTLDFSMQGELNEKLLKLSKGSDLSIYLLLLTALKTLLYRFTPPGMGADEVEITVVSPVYKPDVTDETLNNYVCIGNCVHGHLTFKELLLKIRETVQEAYDHQDYPLDRFGDASQFSDVLCLLEPIHDDGLVRDETFPFALSFGRTDETISGFISYDPLQYGTSFMEQLPGRFMRILEKALSNINVKLSEIDILTEREKQVFIRDFNDTSVQYPDVRRAHHLVEEQAERTRDAIAIRGAGEKRAFTYGQLMEAADELAFLLKEKGAAGGSIIGLPAEPCIEAVVGILGILKAGCAYLPMDPTYPEERFGFMLADSGAALLVGKREELNLVKKINRDLEVIDISADVSTFSKNKTKGSREKTLKGFSGERPAAERKANEPDSPAYIIYTSGSTGRPKGVMVEHGGLVNYLSWARKSYLEPGAKNDFPLYSSLAFDLTVTSIYLPLISGNTLHVYRESEESGKLPIIEIVEANRVEVIKCTPTHLSLIADMEFQNSSVRTFIVGGEMLLTALAERIYEKFAGKITIYNEYGPTETVVGCMIHRFEPGPGASESVPIGAPSDNMQIHLLDRCGLPVPAGVLGEMVICGHGVAAGYLNRPELTAEKFPQLEWGKSYRTGDLASRLPDGKMLFHGRIDQQVKIRGYRIEPAEIENRLLGHRDIKEAVVLPGDGDAGTYLTAYIVSSKVFHVTELREYLGEQLPDYMIPAYFSQVERIPLTPNGKVDGKTLEKEGKQLGSGVAYEAPAGEIEQLIAETWKEELNREQIGVSDNFFDLGGNSVSLLRVHKTLKEKLQKDIPVIKLFRYPTVNALADYLNSGGDDEDKKGVQKNQAAVLPLEEKAWQDIAVIGMAGRFPGAPDIDAFWENLKDGVESIRFFSDDELAESGMDGETISHPDFVNAGALLEDKEKFDAFFFGYIPAEAELMDPQARLFHQCAWEALENAGYNPETYPGHIGLYMGASNSFDWMAVSHLSGKSANLSPFEVEQLTNRDYLSTRISYKLHLTGPSITLQTACSTSLVAIHTACRALSAGECHMALAGGVCVSGAKAAGYIYQEGMIYSSDGHCRAFDADADGTVGGEGVGIVVLKPLQRAKADGDFIRAVIKGSAVNNDGVRKVGYSAPGVEGQAEVIRWALRLANIEPQSIGYIETHGTGTSLGDPIEMEALNVAFGAPGKEGKKKIAVGSVKTNIGHLDAAAGAAGFIKTVLALENKRIPPSLHFKKPNPRIDFDNWHFYVNTKLSEWQPRLDKEGKSLPPRAGVSSFGIGGTNAHILLEAAPPAVDVEPSTMPQTLLLSARTSSALETMTKNLVDYLKENGKTSSADIAFTLQVGRKNFAHRKMTVCSSLEEAIENLSTPGSPLVRKFTVKGDEPKVIFMFPGQGSQYVDMGRELYETEGVFKETIDLALGETGDGFHSALKAFFDKSQNAAPPAKLIINKETIDQTEVAQPLIFLVEIALAKLLISKGIKPDAMIGHSIGEYAAACLAGVFGLKDALKLVTLRGKLMQSLPKGSMLAVSLGEKGVKELLENNHVDLSLAAVNSTSLCVVSGPTAAVEIFAEEAEAKGLRCRRLHTSHAYHSTMMEPILEEFEKAVKAIELKEPSIPYISNISGAWIKKEQTADPAYWAQHIRQTVRFGDGLKELLTGAALFLEVGPGQNLNTFVGRHEAKEEFHRMIQLMRRPEETASDAGILAEGLGRVWLYGKSLEWEKGIGANNDKKRKRVPLPTYPFEPQTYWMGGDPARLMSEAASGKEKGNIFEKKGNIADWFYVPSWQLAPLPPVTGKNSASLFTLIFTENDGFGEALGDKLRMEAGREDSVVIVKKRINGKGLIAEKNHFTYAIDHTNKEDYAELFQLLLLADRIPHRVVHCWNLGPERVGEPAAENVKEALENGFYSLVYLAAALKGVAWNSDTVDIFIVSSGLYNVAGGEKTAPEKALLSGPCRLIPQEFPGLFCFNIDVPFTYVSKNERARLLKLFSYELGVAASNAGEGEAVVAFRGGRRWAQHFRSVPLEAPGERGSYLKEKGVYLITGAPGDHGSMGFILARHLAQTVRARLVLVSRTPLPPKGDVGEVRDVGDVGDVGDENKKVLRKLKMIDELKRLGAEVLTLSADVSDYGQMRDAVEKAESHFGLIDGVIHGAAVMGNDLLAFMIDENGEGGFEKQFVAKIYGLLTLHRVFKGKPLDFCLSTSSLGAIMGPFAAYSAACSFMDAFSHWAANEKEALSETEDAAHFWCSINWDNWQTLEAAQGVEHKAENRDLIMTVDEGVEAFHRVLSWGAEPQVLVSTGDLQTRLDHVPGKKMEEQNSSATQPPTRNRNVAEWFYKPSWKEAPLQLDRVQEEQVEAGEKQNVWLVFSDASPLAAHLAERLEKWGFPVMMVEAGDNYDFERSNCCVIDAGEDDHYDKMFKQLADSGKVPYQIIHLWNVGNREEEMKASWNDPTARDLSLYSIISIGRAIGNHFDGLPSPIRLLVVSSDMLPVTGEETLNPAKAMLLGPVKILPVENGGIRCRSLDISAIDGLGGKENGNNDMERLIDGLLEEFQTNFLWEPVVAYRRGRRLVQDFQPVKLLPFSLHNGEQKQRLKEKGVYLVTGGMGGMGFTIARHLAGQVRARLVLIDIADFPPRELWDEWISKGSGKAFGADNVNSIGNSMDDAEIAGMIGDIREMEKNGAEVFIAKADVSDYGQMKRVITEAEERFGDIDGIIHTAGLIDYAGVMQRRSREDTEKLLAAKVDGTLVLEQIFDKRPLDFLVLFSSLGNILYGIKFGQVGYNAGHEFLEVYAHVKRRQGIFAVTIGWNDWTEVGLAVKAARRAGDDGREMSGMEEIFSINPREGLVVFKRILENDYPQIGVSTYSLGALAERLNQPGQDMAGLLGQDGSGAGDGTEGGQLRDRPDLEVDYVAPGTKMEKQLAGVWQHFFGLRRVGIHDDFFQLGGDSLKATTILAAIHKAINVKIPLAEFFKLPTVKGLAEYAGGAEEKRFLAIEAVEERAFYPLSSGQKRLYVLNQLEPDGIAYNESGVTELEEDVERGLLKKAFDKLIGRHESLRTSFTLVNEEPVQRVHKWEEIAFDVKNYNFPADGSGEVGEIVSGFIRPFDLSAAPLFRVGMISGEGRKPVLMFDMHHIVTDGISMEIFQRELMDLYKGETLSPLRLQYKDFAMWQTDEKGTGEMAKQLTYWEALFKDGIPILNLPVDYPRPDELEFAGDTVFFDFSPEETAVLDRFVGEEEVTLFMVLLALFYVLLYRLSNEEDIVVGTPTAGRGHPDLQGIIGMFVNTVALRPGGSGDMAFRAFLKQVKERTLGAFGNQDCQLEDIVERVVTVRDAGRSPLFDVMFALHRVDGKSDGMPVSESSTGYIHPVSKFDLTLIGRRDNEEMGFRFVYRVKLFKRETIERFVGYFKEVVAAVGGDGDIKLKDIPLSHDLYNEKIEVPEVEFSF